MWTLVACEQKASDTSSNMVWPREIGDITVVTPDEAAIADAYKAIPRKV